MLTTDPFKRIDRAFEVAKQARLSRESEWQLIADYFMPRKDFSVVGRPTELRKRRLTSSVPPVSLRRSAAMLTGFMIDPTQPFIRPNAEMGMITAGRATGLGAVDRDYLDGMSWSVFDHMLRPKAGYISSTSQIALELLGFGTGIRATIRRPGFGPVYRARPLRSCWIEVNSDGDVDGLFYEYSMRLWEVLQRFENARFVEGWRDADEVKLQQEVTLLHVVRPRANGEKGGWATRKPFAEFYVCMDKKVILEEAGYDSFPFSVPRLEVEPGSPYGTGLCWNVLPDAIALSNLQQGVENAVDLKVAPPILRPGRMFGKPLDRRPGADNEYDPSQIGFQSVSEAVKRLDLAGDVSIGDAYMARLVQNIEMGMNTDWMRLRDSGNVTAEEIIERRDLRIRTMSAFVPGVDRDLMGTDADRTVDILFAEGRLPRPPASLAGIEVDWDYGGPLAQAQMQRVADAFGRVLDMASRAKELDPAAVAVLNVEEGLRAVAEAYGQGVGVTRPREEVEAMRLRAEARAEQEQAANDTLTLAQAVQAGGQGAANLASIGQPGQQAA